MNEAYQTFNQTLAQALRTSDTAKTSTFAAPSGQGVLIVQVTLAKGAIPVPRAVVTVYAEDGQTILAKMQTDVVGRTAPLSLPAPPASYSQAPQSDLRPYSRYDVKVEYNGYYTEDAIHVPIFDQTTSIQPIQLIPLPEGGDRGDIIIDEDNTAPL